jgi:Protein of unknown function (DUF751)
MGDLWNTISKYPRFLIGVTLGVILNGFSPLLPLFKRPVTAIALTAILIALLSFFVFTLKAMLGIEATEL